MRGKRTDLPKPVLKAGVLLDRPGGSKRVKQMPIKQKDIFEQQTGQHEDNKKQ